MKRFIGLAIVAALLAIPLVLVFTSPASANGHKVPVCHWNNAGQFEDQLYVTQKSADKHLERHNQAHMRNHTADDYAGVCDGRNEN